MSALLGHFPAAARGLPVLAIGWLCSLWVGRYYGRWGRKVTFWFMVAMYLTFDVILPHSSLLPCYAIGTFTGPDQCSSKNGAPGRGDSILFMLWAGGICLWALICTIGPKDDD